MNRTCRVLLVEDDLSGAHLLHTVLLASKQPAYDISWVGSLSEAKHQLVNKSIDVLLLDLSLPDSSGMNTYNAMREAANGKPVIVMIGDAEYALAQKALDAGAQDYLLKDNLNTETARRAIRYAISLARLEQRLKESETLCRFALDGSGIGAWDWEIHSGKVMYSKRWKSMLGLTDDEIGNRFDIWKGRIHPDDLAQTMAQIETYLAGGSDVYLSEHRLCCKDGTWKWIRARGIAVSHGASGKPLRIIGTHTDINEQKQAEAALHELRQQLEQRVEQRVAELAKLAKFSEPASLHQTPRPKAVESAPTTHANTQTEVKNEEGHILLAQTQPINPPITALPNDPSLIDLRVLARLLNHNQEKLYKFTFKFLQTFQDGIQELEASLQHDDPVALFALGHRLKGTAKAVGAMGLAELCGILETMGGDSETSHSEQINNARPIVSQLRPLLERITQQIMITFADNQEQ